MNAPKYLGLAGYVLLLVGIPAVALWLALAAYNNPDADWVGVGAIAVLLAGIASLVASRLLLTTRPHDDEARVEEDPIQPEVTPEEAAEYEAHYHGGTAPGR